MNIYYDSEKECWYTASTDNYFFGSSKKRLSTDKPHSDHIAFPIVQHENKIGPLIGIMIARNKHNKIIGNGELFKRLQKQLQQYIGGIIIIFPPDNLQKDQLTGYIFCSTRNKWIKAITPLPNIVYNRVPFRKTEKQDVFQTAVSFLKEKGIPFFNSSFINKWDLYELFSEYPMLSEHLPKTSLLEEKENFVAFFLAYKNIYLKPAEGFKGKNIYRIRRENEHSISISTTEDTAFFSTLDELWNQYHQEWLDKNYLIQEEIDGALYNGSRYDFRLLVTFEENRHVLTGVGVRQSNQQDVTTHIPSGGKMLAYQDVQQKEHDLFFEKLVNHCGGVLTKKYGFIGEFSIDACVDKKGNYYLFEINAKPMLFDEDEIEEKRCQQLIKLFYKMTNFPFKNKTD
ncbi:YheC/YheD family protein [Niallia sp.]|uniref:YheC/YheD family endospore coat-associated protein n=1 Tax=Niallia sp. TaxID=2837523 RepID=UPI0028A22AAD|nr:YheC/YheD family protein [Niallia sp.]